VGVSASSAMDEWQACLSMQRAVKRGDLDEMERLVGEDPSLLENAGHGWAPLVEASKQGLVEVVRWLLDRGADIDNRDVFGGTALYHAVTDQVWYNAPIDRRLPVAWLLMERGANPAIVRREIRTTPLMAACHRDNSEDTVHRLLSYPSCAATINFRNANGMTALWWACYRGRPRLVRLLLQNGADPTICDKGANGTAPAPSRSPGARATRTAWRSSRWVALLSNLLPHG
jgi:ankyrin repeat protein